MQTGKIGVTSENIFPIIKKFLYSEHEIFLRELISNAVDATQKLKTVSSMGDYKEDILIVADEYVGVDWGNSIHHDYNVDVKADLTKSFPFNNK